ncbi:hypothetical protein [Streptomyces chartreusis]|nr:hypothetical protein POD33_36000 [Streptomyces moderatus]
MRGVLSDTASSTPSPDRQLGRQVAAGSEVELDGVKKYEIQET